MDGLGLSVPPFSRGLFAIGNSNHHRLPAIRAACALRAMWVRSAPPFHLGVSGVAISLFLVIKPLIDLISSVRSRESWMVGAWLLAAIAGAWAAAYSLRNFRRETLRELVVCLATAGTVGCGLVMAVAFTLGGDHEPAWSRVRTGLASFLQYVPAAFLLARSSTSNRRAHACGLS